MPTGDIVKLRLVYQSIGGEIQNQFVIRYRTNTAAGADLMTHFDTTLKAGWLAAFAPQVQLVNYQVEDLYPGRAALISQAPGGNDAANTGSFATAASAPQTAAVVSWRTAFRGQGNRGRTFVGPVPTAEMASGRISSAYQTVVAAAAQSLLADFNGVGGAPNANYEMVLWRGHLSRVPSATLNQQDVNAGGAAGSGAGEPYFNPITAHVNHKPVYEFPETSRTNPLQPRAALPITSRQVQLNLTVQRRRGVGVTITRFHRV